ncbi:MAG: ABC transporter permease [Maledivibacter sp.]|jgi:putative ABC transport system permease protein|nr:ABC transporter permease [Maledivibacter sp.]
MNELLISTLSQGFIFAIAALGIYITFRILDFPDLSVDGTFTTGAAICAIVIKMGGPPILALVLSILGGIVAGACTGLLHVKLGITNILSGIIVMIGLYSINLRIMGKSNIHLFDVNHMFTGLNAVEKTLIVLVFVICLKVIMDIFFKTQKGYVLKALGENPQFVVSLGFDAGSYKILGLIMANACVALSGGLYAQYQGFSDVGMGTGLIVSGLASIVIGEMLFKRITFFKVTTIVVLGSMIYRAILSAALKFGLNASDLKLITAVIMVVILSGVLEKFAGIFKPKGVKVHVATKKSIQDI